MTRALLTCSDLAQAGRGPLVVALSGGVDSCALLHALAALPEARGRGLRALHIHHGLHADAEQWTVHCERLCDSLNVLLQIRRVEVDRSGKEGLEAAARHARRAAFDAELRDGEVLVLAHHRDDQAETFLLRALRASGPDGLAAMRRWRAFGRGWLWRPLLDRSRAEVTSYAQAHGVRWMEDPSNADVRFDRNFLRLGVMPLLRERWPHADAAFARSAQLCAQASDLLGEDDARALEQVRTDHPHAISRSGLRALSPARRARVLRLWIATLGLPALPAEGVARIEVEILDARADAEPGFAWSNAVLRGWRDLLHAARRREELADGWRQEWTGDAPLTLPDGSKLRLEGADRFERPLIVHARQGGERITLPGRSHSHSLKHVLQDLGVPPWVRAALPLLSDADGELLAAGDLACSASFDRWLRQHGARVMWDRCG